MIRRRKGIVKEILNHDSEIAEILVEVENKIEKAINYNQLTGTVEVGNEVLLNTSAVFLSLGTGGYHFVIDNLCHHEVDFDNLSGHIMKLRYTPIQLKCMAVEEQNSPYHEMIKEADSISGMKVLIGSLHSMLAPAMHIMKEESPYLKVAYIMTDSACLPLAFSRTVKQLRSQMLLHSTITCGQAFGGDYETVNVYTALLTAKHICQCDVAIIIPGPGVVGTGTMMGFSNIEEGHLIDAVNSLGGFPIVIPRMSFCDHRDRHRGISHHTITILNRIAHTAAYVALPMLEAEKHNWITRQIQQSNIHNKHKIRYVQEDTLSILQRRKVTVKTMGRDMMEDPDFFRAVGAAAKFCCKF